MTNNRLNSRGITLIELLIAVFIASLIGIGTAEALGTGRALRERARHRANLVLAAQSELDRLRTVPLDTLAQGTQTLSGDAATTNVTLSDNVQRRADGFTELRVTALRHSVSGDMSFAITSIHPGGRR